METEYINRKTQLVTYLQLHIQSLNEDLSNLSKTMDTLELTPDEEFYVEFDEEE